MAKTTLQKLKEKQKKAPNKSGIYIWRNSRKKPIYIGRASSIKNRLQGYFNSKDTRIQEMVESARYLEWQETKTLLEAVILEANLIKKHWPKYNVKDKDDRSFVYLVILKQDFPKPLIIRGKDLKKYLSEKGRKNKRALEIFGPYQSHRILKTALELVRPIFPYSTCRENASRPCFHYQIGLCPGVCAGKADKKEYAKNIKNLSLFFKGDKKRLLTKLKKENADAIKSLDQVRDIGLLQKSSSLLQKSNELSKLRIEGYDISHLSGKDPVGAMVVFENNEANPSEYRIFKIRGAKTQSDTDMLKEVLERRLKHKEWDMPDIVFIDGGLAQVRAAKNVLNMFSMYLPVVGLSKAGMHSKSSAKDDKLVILNAKKVGKDILISSKKVFQQVRDEAHRFAISFNRRQGRKRLFKN